MTTPAPTTPADVKLSPIGVFYFAVPLVLVGALVLVASGYALGAALIGATITLSGVMLICTGLILRGLHRLGHLEHCGTS